jgi:hypothetical protein
MTVQFESYLNNIVTTIRKTEKERRKEVVKFLAREMRKNIQNKSDSLPGGFPGMNTRTLRKSIGFKTNGPEKNTSIVGSKDWKAHLLEFGHGDGKTRNKRPFIMPTIMKNESKIKDMLSKEYF